MTLRDYLVKQLVDDGVWEWRAIDIVDNLKNDAFFCNVWTPQLKSDIDYYPQRFLESAVSFVLGLAEKEF